MHVERAVRNELRPADALVREAAGRWWLLASELGAGGGRSLAERVADAVAGAATQRRRAARRVDRRRGGAGRRHRGRAR